MALLSIDAEFPGADQKQREEDGAEFDGVGGDFPFVKKSPRRGIEMHRRGDRHCDQKEETGRAECEADQQQESSDGFREGGHEAPEPRKGAHADELHRFAELDPEFGSLHQLRQTMGKKGEADENTQDEKAGIAVFAEGAKYHRMEMPLSAVSDKENESLHADFRASRRRNLLACCTFAHPEIEER